MERKRGRRIEEAWKILDSIAFVFGIDRVVERPADVLIRRLRVSRQVALSLIHQLSARKIVSVRKMGLGNAVEEVVMLQPFFFARKDGCAEDRVFLALKRVARDGVILRHQFSDVWVVADEEKHVFYAVLEKLRRKGFVDVMKDGPRIMEVRLL